jgi:hypothetical protein
MAQVIQMSPNGAGRRHTIDVPVEERSVALEPPKRLNAAQRKVWDKHIEPCKWLQDSDVLLAYAFVCLSAKLLKDSDDVTAAELSQMRLMAGDLGLRPAERQRLTKGKPKANQTDEFFGKRG